MGKKLKIELDDEQITVIAFSLGCYLGSMHESALREKKPTEEWNRWFKVANKIMLTINEAREKRMAREEKITDQLRADETWRIIKRHSELGGITTSSGIETIKTCLIALIATEREECAKLAESMDEHMVAHHIRQRN